MDENNLYPAQTGINNFQADAVFSDNKIIKNILTIGFLLIFVWSIYGLYVLVGLASVLGRSSGDISFIFKLSPIMFFLIMPSSIASFYFFYMIFKIRTMNKSSWVLAMFFPLVVIFNIIITRIALGSFLSKLNQIAGQGDIPKVSQLSILNIISYLLFFIMFILLIVSRNKFNSYEDKISGTKKIFLYIYGVIILLVCIIFIGNAWWGSYEKSFIGYSKIESILGKKPIYFNYIPQSIELTGIPGNKVGNEKAILVFNNPKNVTDLEKLLIVNESTIKPDLKDSRLVNKKGNSYYIFKSESKERTILIFEKNGVWVSMATIKKSYITDNELFKIAESAR
ncbi:hypothetical protein COS74_01525 [bacterium CG06_land_8_20_14_3_00_33_50]|nr:MAG: hypothetical protein COU50_00100 [bacterium CG10_big_fil_rev_8_21_14_0_10_33_18]PIU76921.1 MAG: hypothetical protein COS74_01525 [bacterium CG06_land_8_20_14_3_00_33_50]PIW81028.1 MAG: hypothetical protein COZ97_03940 [bacterium CG_4_8_14_3_um_filter_33_28]PJA71749.1 MAG: hypothetical protein CO152_05025 [bacterium CG_4_9_14_3_um_filter_33_26]